MGALFSTCLGLTTEARMREMHAARMQFYDDLMKMLQQTEERLEESLEALEESLEALEESLEAVLDQIPMRVYNSEEVKATWLAQTVLNDGGVLVDTNGQPFVAHYGDGAQRAPFLLCRPCPHPRLRLWRQPRHRNRHRRHAIAHRLHAARAAAVACRTRTANIAVCAVPSPPRAARAPLLFVA
ncbi:hypothetical protein JKP88DRAFT_254631 [Tribonema minus]|uniref:Uncharacterized protein n=1 Tax=Tribonema minus TaxID=303371 RepID=A0A836CHC2_9STRA|nr:hypothetical protein JKP88DRAFT_254631 [Tribonema minus]